MKVFLRITLLLSIMGIGYSLFHIFIYTNEYKTSEKKYNQLQEVHDESSDESSNTLQQMNEDYVGWLSVDDTKIDYPVVKSDDNDFYLDHNFHKDEDRVGAIFMDYRNSISSQDDHTIIYGHHMKDESMFATLTNVLEKDFSESNRIKLEFEDETYEWEIFSAYVTEDTDWMQIDFDSDDDFGHFKTDLMNNSSNDFSTQPNEKNMLTLATCTTEAMDERVTVHAKQVKGD